MFPALILSAMFFLSQISKTTPAPASLCNIVLRPDSVVLLRDVERRFGKPVRCDTSEALESQGAFSQSRIAPDGTPTITLSTFSGKTEEHVVHELFHLQLRARGFPQVFMAQLPPNVDQELFQQTVRHVADLIEHRLFYPKMRRMGFDPTAEYRKEVEYSLSHDQLVGSQLPEKRIIDYAHVALLIDDRTLTQRLEKWYVRKGWQEQLNRGKTLVHYLTTFNPDSPDKKHIAVERCLEIVFGKKISIEWQSSIPSALHNGESTASPSPLLRLPHSRAHPGPSQGSKFCGWWGCSNLPSVRITPSNVPRGDVSFGKNSATPPRPGFGPGTGP